MMSETAFFVKDVMEPKGCVSIVAKEAGVLVNLIMWTPTPKQNLCEYIMQILMAIMLLPNLMNGLISRTSQIIKNFVIERTKKNSLRIAFACDESVKTGLPVML
jgi:hypothetical protein